MKKEKLFAIKKDMKYVSPDILPLNTCEILKWLNKLYTAIEKLNMLATKWLTYLPRGTLRYTETDKTVQFFRRTDKKDFTGTYIPATDTQTPRLLAQKGYFKEVVKASESDLNQISKAIKLLSGLKLESKVNGKYLPETEKHLVTPLILSDRDYALAWLNDRSPVLDAFGELKVATGLGFNVRNKSEGMIVDVAVSHGIPLKYEPELTLPDGTYFRPDFVILDLRDRSEIYIEHFGFIDNKEYRDKMCRKINRYARNGIIIGKNFIPAFETADVVFDREAFYEMIKSMLDLSLYEDLSVYSAA